MNCLQIFPKLSANVASSWNSRLQHSGISASLLPKDQLAYTHCVFYAGRSQNINIPKTSAESPKTTCNTVEQGSQTVHVKNMFTYEVCIIKLPFCNFCKL